MFNQSEAQAESLIKAKEKAALQFKEQQNFNAELNKRMEALKQESLQTVQRMEETEAEK